MFPIVVISGLTRFCIVLDGFMWFYVVLRCFVWLGVVGHGCTWLHIFCEFLLMSNVVNAGKRTRYGSGFRIFPDTEYFRIPKISGFQIFPDTG